VKRLRSKLILVFLGSTLVPVAALMWMSALLLEHSLSYVATDDLDRLSKSLEGIAREYYRQAREDLKAEVATGRLAAQRFAASAKTSWPAPLRQFWESQDADRFMLSEPDGDRLEYMVRRGPELLLYSRNLGGVRMDEVTRQYRQARFQVERLRQRDLRRGFLYTLILLSAIIWAVSLASVVFLANRISRPIRELTDGLFELAGGNFAVRLRSARRDEIGRAIQAFNHTAGHLQQSRDRLIYLPQIASWQALARKMAHELKNSLTPIRLTVEEIVARQPAVDQPFLEQAAQVVVDEVSSLERRLRAFSEFAVEPATNPAALDINGLLEERIQFLRVAHPDVAYVTRFAEKLPAAWADADQVKGILTNLLENAAEAAGRGGKVLGVTGTLQGKVLVEVHDSGPGLSEEARSTLFEPSISFKKHGMGLGLSISRKNALLAGGDLQAIEGQLGGAGFRLLLPPEKWCQEAVKKSMASTAPLRSRL
jgi:two-component system nitrogen regulation sensor histidine kinase NtrY